MGKLAILVKSGQFEILNNAALLASGAIANGNDVLMFFMHDAVWALQKDIIEKNRTVHSDFSAVKQKIEEQDKQGKLITWFQLLPDLKEIGDLKIIAFGLMIDNFQLKKEQLADFVDDIAGVAFFTDYAMEADKVITL